MYHKIVLIFFTVFYSINGFTYIYLDDDRIDVHQVNDQKIIDLSKSTATQIFKEKYTELATGDYKVKRRRVHEAELDGVGFCPEVNFRDQLFFGECSGFLVSKNLLVTAGHCMDEAHKCTDAKWFFNMNYENSEKETVPGSSVYGCEEIVASLRYADVDFAIIKLDQDVQGFQPLEYRKKGKVEDGEEIFMIGNPYGLPTKVTENAFVMSSKGGNHFSSYIDAFGGNSGSAIFNRLDYLVEGILVSGGSDYTLNKKRNCYEENVCKDLADEECSSGEGIVKITSLEIDKFVHFVETRKPIKSFLDYCLNSNDQSIQKTIGALKSKYNKQNCEELNLQLKNVKRLNLNNSGVTNLRPLASFTNIKKLHLKNNLVKDIRPILSLEGLTHLHLEGNPIEKDEINCPTPIWGSAEVKAFCRRYRNLY